MPVQVLLVPSADFVAVDLPGPTTRARCEAAAEAWKTAKYDWVVPSGAMCFPPEIETKPDAFIMRDLMAELGIPEDRQLVEWHALDTYTNAFRTVELLEHHGIIDYNITVVSQWQHCHRFVLVFRYNYGMEITSIPLPAPYSLVQTGLWVYHHYDRKGNKKLARNERAKRFHPYTLPDLSV